MICKIYQNLVEDFLEAGVTSLTNKEQKLNKQRSTNTNVKRFSRGDSKVVTHLFYTPIAKNLKMASWKLQFPDILSFLPVLWGRENKNRNFIFCALCSCQTKLLSTPNKNSNTWQSRVGIVENRWCTYHLWHPGRSKEGRVCHKIVNSIDDRHKHPNINVREIIWLGD